MDLRVLCRYRVRYFVASFVFRPSPVTFPSEYSAAFDFQFYSIPYLPHNHLISKMVFSFFAYLVFSCVLRSICLATGITQNVGMGRC